MMKLDGSDEEIVARKRMIKRAVKRSNRGGSEVCAWLVLWSTCPPQLYRVCVMLGPRYFQHQYASSAKPEKSTHDPSIHERGYCTAVRPNRPQGNTTPVTM
jgi:hypothetical protein